MGLYDKTSPTINYYSAGSVSSEPNMRQELINTLDGYFPEVSKAHPALLRKMRRDDDGVLIECACVDPVTREPDKDRYCPICLGEGYYWDEENVSVYSVPVDSSRRAPLKDVIYEAGLLNIDLVVFYLRYSTDITTKDKIIKIRLKQDGSIYTPYERKEVYRIGALWEYRSDNGKLEYWKVSTHKEDVKYLNSPVYGDLK